MSMEPSWVVTCDSGWSMEEAAAAWSSEHRISFQTSLPSHSDSHSGVQQQVVEYASPSPSPVPATHDNNRSYPIQVFKEAVEEFNANYSKIMAQKMHRFPPSLVDVDIRYREPVTVAIGPIHHARLSYVEGGLSEAESVKHVAADQCIAHSSRSLEEMYTKVSSVSGLARRLYHPSDVVKFGHRDDFVPMMFFDACFLVQFMRWHYLPDKGMHHALNSYFYANRERIRTDIMMLENQIPWVVVKTILDFMPPAPLDWSCPWEAFVKAMRRGLKNKIGRDDNIDVLPGHHPPHVLGLVWHYIVGNKNQDPLPPNDDDDEDPIPPNDDDDDEDPIPPNDNNNDNDNDNNNDNTNNKPMAISITVDELADIGITLLPKENAGLVEMQIEKRTWCFFKVAKLFVGPLYLTEANATWLVNMAAFESCKTPNFLHPSVLPSESAVCSYLHLFAMLLDRKEHVHNLQKKKVIEGGGLTSKEALDFFTSIGKNMRIGSFYVDIIVDIHYYDLQKSDLARFIHYLGRNKTKLAGLLSIIAAVAGILSSLQALKPS
ncbi:hypothetical protein CFC21_000218 [Triticum aestivum]|uniref:Uncharacterized protein n=1 Tax=Triticum aestivum TaxID=4565 RepID=A0A3B5XTC0_WHEAT|nr:uncharacterized protein LOC123067875 [Triticum aestivum]KAF6981761.1 hypothetical protein CFC21_000218 [Triticum aestivum]